MELKELILETCKAHADTAREAYKSRDREVAILKGQIAVLIQTIADIRAENQSLRIELRKAGGIPSSDVMVVR